MKNLSAFERIGLSRQENMVYKMLVVQGHASASIVVRKTGLHRPAVYGALAKLIERNLVVVVPHGKQKYYRAEPPEKIRELLEDLNFSIDDEIEELERQQIPATGRPLVTYGEGPEAIKGVYLDLVKSLKRGETYFRYSSSKDISGDRYLPTSYRKIRDAKQLQRFVITNEPNKNRKINRLGRLIKTVPPDYDLFNYDISQIIYGNKTALIDFNTLTTITIEDPIIAEFQKKIFKLLFKKL